MPCNVQTLLVSSSQQSFKVLVFILMNWNKQTNKQKDCHLPKAEYWSWDWNHKSLTPLRKFPFPVLLSSVQSLSPVWLFVTAAHQASLSITNSWSLPKHMSIESVMPSNHISSVIPFFSRPQSFPASGSFQMSQLFASGGQSIGVSASTSVLPMNTQDWSPLGWTSWISLQTKGLSRVFSNTTVQKHQFFGI